jgi:hypothetical protein
LQKRGFAGLPWRVKHPVQFVPDVTVKLGADQPVRRGQHIVIVWIAGAGSVKKAYWAFFHSSQFPLFAGSTAEWGTRSFTKSSFNETSESRLNFSIILFTRQLFALSIFSLYSINPDYLKNSGA